MGTKTPDKCVFCNKELEEWNYEYFVENKERACLEDFDDMDGMNICKDCVKRLSKLIKYHDALYTSDEKEKQE